MEKNLQVARKKEEQSAGFVMVEMRKLILVEISTIEAIMQRIYDEVLTMHKVTSHLFGF